MNHLQHRAESLIPLVSGFSGPQSRWVGEIDMSLFAGFPIVGRQDRRVIVGHQPMVTGDRRLGAGSMAIRGLELEGFSRRTWARDLLKDPGRGAGGSCGGERLPVGINVDESFEVCLRHLLESRNRLFRESRGWLSRDRVVVRGVRELPGGTDHAEA